MNPEKALKQIFIIDDDKSVCRALSILLGTYGFTVSAFISADQFFRAVPYNVQGCLILDIHMPKVDGWEALMRIIRSRAHIPVIMISADKSGNLKEKALKAGAEGYLQKPFNGQALVDLITMALEKRSSADRTIRK